MKLPSKVKSLGDAATLAIEKFFHKILSHETEVLKDREPEELHQMRVGMRRLRSAVTGFGPVLDLPEAASEHKIGKISRVLGSLRDLDVMLDSLQHRYAENLPASEQEEIDKALLHLLKKRHRALKGVRAILEHKPYQNLKQALQDWLEKPRFQAIAQLPIEEVLPDLLLPQISELFLHPGWLVGTEIKAGAVQVSAELDPERIEAALAQEGLQLHDLRKQAKRVRYLMNLFTDFYGSTYEVYVDDVKAIQECLGDIQDSLVLEEYLTEFFECNLKEELPAFSGLLVSQRTEAWQKWQLLQRRYLSTQIRHNFRSELLRPALENSENGNGH